MTDVRSPRSTHNLTKRAGLTFTSNLLRQGAQILIGFVVTPVIIRGLGAELYGALQMIEQAIQYVSRSDLRPTGTLRVLLSVRQRSDDNQEKKRLVGAASLLCLAMLPFLLVAGTCLSLAAPSFIKVDPDYAVVVQITMAIAVLRIGLDKLLGLPGSILSGVNLEYKAMGVNAGAILVGGGLSVLAIKSGWGLVGIGVAALASVLLNGGIRYFVARKYVPWLGVARPSKSELLGFTKSSSWFFLSSIADAFLNVSDLLIIGIVLGPAAAGIYATTGAVLRMAVGPVSQMLSSGSAGIGELCGRRDWHRIMLIRHEMYTVAIVVMTIIGTGIIGFNKSFLTFWVGGGFYSGDLVNIAMVLIAYIKILLRSDSLLLDNFLIFKERSIAFLFSGIFTLFLGLLLTYYAGAVGMSLAVLIGQLVLFIYCRKLIKVHLGKFYQNNYNFNKLIFICLMLLSISYIIKTFFYDYNIFIFVFFVMINICFNVLILWKYGLTESSKISLTLRVKSLISANKN